MIYGYARVSTLMQAKGKKLTPEEAKENKITDKENLSNSLISQESALREAGAIEIVHEAMSGKNTNRPKLQEILNKMVKGDTLVAIKLDRISRNASEGSTLIKDLVNIQVFLV